MSALVNPYSNESYQGQGTPKKVIYQDRLKGGKPLRPVLTKVIMNSVLAILRKL